MHLKTFICIYLLYHWSEVNADCGVVSKKEWGGRDPIHVKYLARPMSLVIVQYMSPIFNAYCSTDANCAKNVKSIQILHMDKFLYRDIGPSFVIGGNGKVYEGSGWLHVGAHTRGYNNKSIGIVFIGDYNHDEVKQSMLDAFMALLKCGVENGHLTPDYHVVTVQQIMNNRFNP